MVYAIDLFIRNKVDLVFSVQLALNINLKIILKKNGIFTVLYEGFAFILEMINLDFKVFLFYEILKIK